MAWAATFARLPSIVRAMCSTPTEFGCAMNSLEAGYLMLNFRRARRASLISSRHAEIRSRTLPIWLNCARFEVSLHKPCAEARAKVSVAADPPLIGDRLYRNNPSNGP